MGTLRGPQESVAETDLVWCPEVCGPNRLTAHAVATPPTATARIPAIQVNSGPEATHLLTGRRVERVSFACPASCSFSPTIMRPRIIRRTGARDVLVALGRHRGAFIHRARTALCHSEPVATGTVHLQGDMIMPRGIKPFLPLKWIFWTFYAKGAVPLRAARRAPRPSARPAVRCAADGIGG
jgi:hypothetical protein